MTVPWVGVRKAAIVPVFDRGVDQPPAADWFYRVATRTFHDPNPTTGQDRSFQNYLRAQSYGSAFLEGNVFPNVIVENTDALEAACESLPTNHGYRHLIAVLPHSQGPNRSSHAFWGRSPINGITGIARVSLYNDRSLLYRYPIGVWGMEIFHMMCEFGHTSLGRYDVMSNPAANTHACAHTKAAFGWLPASSIVGFDPRVNRYQLQAIALNQPGPPGYSAAVRLLSRFGTKSFLVEARTTVDQYDKSTGGLVDGIPRECVIVYEVASESDVTLKAELTVGQRFADDLEGFSVANTAAITGGFSIRIDREVDPRCASIREEIEGLEELLQGSDVVTQRQIRTAISRLKSEARQRRCAGS